MLRWKKQCVDSDTPASPSDGSCGSHDDCLLAKARLSQQAKEVEKTRSLTPEIPRQISPPRHAPPCSVVSLSDSSLSSAEAAHYYRKEGSRGGDGGAPAGLTPAPPVSMKGCIVIVKDDSSRLYPPSSSGDTKQTPAALESISVSDVPTRKRKTAESLFIPGRIRLVSSSDLSIGGGSDPLTPPFGGMSQSEPIHRPIKVLCSGAFIASPEAVQQQQQSSAPPPAVPILIRPVL